MLMKLIPAAGIYSTSWSAKIITQVFLPKISQKLWRAHNQPAQTAKNNELQKNILYVSVEKAAYKNVDKIDTKTLYSPSFLHHPAVNFINVLHARISYKILASKITELKHSALRLFDKMILAKKPSVKC
jgi:hypothetical protein